MRKKHLAQFEMAGREKAKRGKVPQNGGDVKGIANVVVRWFSRNGGQAKVRLERAVGHPYCKNTQFLFTKSAKINQNNKNT